MDSPEFSDRGLNPMTPEHAGHNGRVVHYFGHGGEGVSMSPRKHGGRLHPKADAALLLLRLLTLGFSLASLVLMATNTSTVRGHTVKWVDFDAYRYVVAASAIVCLYSFAEIGLGLWYLFKGRMLMPDSMAHWFDFGHDQVFFRDPQLVLKPNSLMQMQSTVREALCVGHCVIAGLIRSDPSRYYRWLECGVYLL